jgi:hypothetical protein
MLSFYNVIICEIFSYTQKAGLRTDLSNIKSIDNSNLVFIGIETKFVTFMTSKVVKKKSVKI